MRLIDADALKDQLELQRASYARIGATERAEAFANCLWEIEQSPTISGWISVKDGLPEDGEHVLAYIERDSWTYGTSSVQRKREIAIGYHVSGRWNVDGCNKIIGICWMPLPEPPQKAVEPTRIERNDQNGSKNCKL